MAKKTKKKAKVTPAQRSKRIEAKIEQNARLAVKLTAKLAKVTAERDKLAAELAALVAPPPVAVAPQAP
jgi:hypothetical protein